MVIYKDEIIMINVARPAKHRTTTSIVIVAFFWGWKYFWYWFIQNARLLIYDYSTIHCVVRGIRENKTKVVNLEVGEALAVISVITLQKQKLNIFFGENYLTLYTWKALCTFNLSRKSPILTQFVKTNSKANGYK